MIIALALIFMVPAMALAEKSVDISGTYYMWALDLENYADFDDSNSADDQAYFYSKMRVGTTIKPADDITVYWRMDLAEGGWGAGTPNGLQTPWADDAAGDDKIQVDYVWAQITKEYGSVRIGHQWFGFGNQINAIMNEGINVTITPPDMPFKVNVMYAKLSEGPNAPSATGTANRTDVTGQQDADFFGLNFNYMNENIGMFNFFAALTNDKALDSDITLLGVQYASQFGPVGINAELNLYGGDVDAVGGADFKGQQLFLQATMNPTDKIMVAAQLLYAKGYDGANEVQVSTLTNVGDLGAVSPFDHGIMNTEWPFATTGFEMLGANAGVEALNFIADFKVAEGILIQASLGYASPQEDNQSTFDHAIIYNIGATFDIATNTKFGVQYNQMLSDRNTGLSDDDAKGFMAALYLNF